MRADEYSKLDKELLEMCEDVLLNRCENATERMLDFAATLDPKSKPTAVVRKGQVCTHRAHSLACCFRDACRAPSCGLGLLMRLHMA